MLHLQGRAEPPAPRRDAGGEEHVAAAQLGGAGLGQGQVVPASGAEPVQPEVWSQNVKGGFEKSFGWQKRVLVATLVLNLF